MSNPLAQLLILDRREAWNLIESGSRLIDVRTASEYEQGHLQGAINIPHDQIAARLSEFSLSKEERVVLYCKSGGRSDFAMKLLHSMGYSNAVNAGGYEELVAAR
jgi:phage shock protein E